VRLFNELQVRNRDLTEALEQQTATSDILRVIASSPTDVQPVFDTIVRNAARVCEAFDAVVVLADGEEFVQRAHHGPIAAALGARYPLRGTVSGRAILEARIVHVENLAEASDYPAGRELAQRVGYRTTLSVPLLLEGVAIGAIGIRRTEVLPFSEQQIALLQTFADQAVIAIQNVRLFTELDARNSELRVALEQQTATSELLKVIGRSTFDLQPVFETLAENAVRLCGAERALVERFDGQVLRTVATRNVSPELRAFVERHPVAPGRHSVSARAALERRSVHIPDVRSDPEFTYAASEINPVRTALSVPMLRADELLGTIFIYRHEVRPFTDSQITLMETFADQAAIAIENARLLTELQARTGELTLSVDRLTALGDVGRAVSSSLDLEQVLTTIVSRAVQLSEMDAGAIYEYDEVAEVFWLRATQNLPAEFLEIARPMALRKGEGAAGRLAVTREPVQIPDIAAPEAYQSRLRDVLLRIGHRALLAVPLVSEDRVVGGLIVNRRQPGEFAPEVINLLRTFATQSALAIQNARLYRELEVKGRELEAASRHKSEFLANMSHELRTPLNAIIGFSEVLNERMFGELNEKQDEYLKDINASGQHLLSLINDILDLSKIEAGRMELELTDFNLPATLDNALTLVRERAGRRGIALGLTVDERLEQIRADERKVRQVVLNLLSNAIKFTPEGGRIEVRAVPLDGIVEISVSDTGVGIAPEDQEAIFEEFKQVGTAAKKVEGTGLGLALSRKFVELHGGRIWVESHTGAGSTFTFTIPMRP
jgi:signal transduction histidine kinase